MDDEAGASSGSKKLIMIIIEIEKNKRIDSKWFHSCSESCAGAEIFKMFARAVPDLHGSCNLKYR